MRTKIFLNLFAKIKTKDVLIFYSLIIYIINFISNSTQNLIKNILYKLKMWVNNKDIFTYNVLYKPKSQKLWKLEMLFLNGEMKKV